MNENRYVGSLSCGGGLQMSTGAPLWEGRRSLPAADELRALSVVLNSPPWCGAPWLHSSLPVPQVPPRPTLGGSLAAAIETPPNSRRTRTCTHTNIFGSFCSNQTCDRGVCLYLSRRARAQVHPCHFTEFNERVRFL